MSERSAPRPRALLSRPGRARVGPRPRSGAACPRTARPVTSRPSSRSTPCPRPWRPSFRPPPARGPTSSAARPGQLGTLLPVSRQVDANGILQSLFDGLTTAEQSDGLRTAIPEDTELLDDRVLPDGTYRIDVSDDIFSADRRRDHRGRGADRVHGHRLPRRRRRWSCSSTASAGPGPSVTARWRKDPLTRFMFPALNPSSRPDYPPLTEDGGPLGHHDDDHHHHRARTTTTTRSGPVRRPPAPRRRVAAEPRPRYPKKMAATSSYMLRSRVRVRPSARRSGARSMRLSR